jgi:hypothetical protein
MIYGINKINIEKSEEQQWQGPNRSTTSEQKLID